MASALKTTEEDKEPRESKAWRGLEARLAGAVGLCSGALARRQDAVTAVSCEAGARGRVRDRGPLCTRTGGLL